VLAAFLTAQSAMAQPVEARDIHFIDAEGGQATRIVPPEGEPLLVDAGWGGAGGRDPHRIMAGARVDAR
jgi:hypothetical protein